MRPLHVLQLCQSARFLAGHLVLSQADCLFWFVVWVAFLHSFWVLLGCSNISGCLFAYPMKPRHLAFAFGPAWIFKLAYQLSISAP